MVNTVAPTRYRCYVPNLPNDYWLLSASVSGTWHLTPVLFCGNRQVYLPIALWVTDEQIVAAALADQADQVA